MIDLVDKRKVLICDTSFCDLFSYIHNHISHENRDDYTIGLKLDYNYKMLLVRTGHPQHKPILKLMHSLNENGIKIKRDKLYTELLVCIFLHNDFISHDVRKKVRETKQHYGSWDHLICLFKLLSFALILSTCCFVIEKLYYFKCFKYF